MDGTYSNGWTLSSPSGEVLESNFSLPNDLRPLKKYNEFQHWIFSTTIPLERISALKHPVFLLGRMGDSDIVRVNGCEIGSTGLRNEHQQSGWWWGALRNYPLSDSCRNVIGTSPIHLEIEIFKWGGPGYGIFGGPIGIGEGFVVNRLARIVEWLRFNTLAIYGFTMLAIGIYYLFVYLLVPGRSYNGVFALCAVSFGVFELVTSSMLYRAAETGLNVMRLNLFSAAMTTISFIWFLYARLRATRLWNVRATFIGSAIAMLVGLPRQTLNGVYEVYEVWFGFFLLTMFLAFGQYLRFAYKNRGQDLWRYTIGFSAFIFSCAYDIVITLLGADKPYIIPYGFLLFCSAVAMALAKEYADAFLYVEAQVAERTKDLGSALEQLRGMEKMKSRFFANVSHDFKTPVAVALGNLEEARQKISGAAATAIDAAEGSLQKLIGMISDLLDTVRSESGTLKMEWERAPIAELLARWAEPCQILCRRKGIALTTHLTGLEAFRVPMDTAKIERVVANLLSNAIKFTDRGEISVSLRTDQARAYIEIDDSGIGIPAEERKKVFDRYFQSSRTSLREHGGSGIGLSFAKEMIDLHNGEIWVEEGKRGGSKFVVALPLSQSVDVAEKTENKELPETAQVLRGSLDVTYPPAVPTGGDPGRPTVLVVEDNPEVAQVVVKALEGTYNVHFAPNGSDGLKRIRSTPYDCVISDIMMPVMSGTEFLRAIREDVAFRAMPVIMLTSRGDVADVVEHLNLGANDFVQKPFRREILLARVRAQIDTRKLRDRLVASDKMVTLGLLSSGIAHEIKNPLLSALNNLTGIENILDAVKKLASTDPKVAEDAKAYLAKKTDRITKSFGAASNSIQRIQIIVDSMRGYTTGSNQRTEVSLPEAIEGALTILAGKIKDRQLVIDRADEGNAKILGYASINQVLVNLIDNAVDAVEPVIGKIKISSRQDGGRAIVAVEDNGVGIPPELLPKIFDPFLTTKPTDQGTGLGLFIARDIVQLQHGGEILVHSTVGKGTTFTLHLPLVAPEQMSQGSIPFHGVDLTVV